MITVQTVSTFDADLTCEYPARVTQIPLEALHYSSYQRSVNNVKCSLTGNTITFLHWAIAEGPISIVSMCLPHITHLAQRARQHGFSSLFTRREYAPSSTSNVGARSALAQDKEGFQRIGKGGTTPFTKDRLVLDQHGTYSVSASADQHFDERHIALGQVHLRQDVSVREDERWALV